MSDLSMLNLLETTREHCGEAASTYTSAIEAHDDAPTEPPLKELDVRFGCTPPKDQYAVEQDWRIDRVLQRVLGTLEAAADIKAEEVGHHIGLSVGTFRAGSITGPSHCGVDVHGFAVRSLCPESRLSRRLTDVCEELVKSRAATLGAC